jgi:hypothetical protein
MPTTDSCTLYTVHCQFKLSKRQMVASCYINRDRNKGLMRIRRKISNDNLHISLDENTCRTGFFTYDSAIGYDTN